jgi:hypothetical protein
MMVVWLFLFRQKNYAFEMFIPFIIFLGYSAGRETALSAIAASVIVPAAFISRAVKMSILETYYQLLGAWAAVLVLLVGAIVQLRRGKPAPAAAIAGTMPEDPTRPIGVSSVPSIGASTARAAPPGNGMARLRGRKFAAA